MVSQYQALAPEEVGGRSKGSFKVKEERTTAEIRRDRRAIKQKIKGEQIKKINYASISTFSAKKAAGIEIKFKNPKKKSDADLRPDDGKKTKWTNSSKVFRLLQEENETGALSAKAAKERISIFIKILLNINFKDIQRY